MKDFTHNDDEDYVTENTENQLSNLAELLRSQKPIVFPSPETTKPKKLYELNLPVVNYQHTATPPVGGNLGFVPVGSVNEYGEMFHPYNSGLIGRVDMHGNVEDVWGKQTGMRADNQGIVRPILPPQVPFYQPPGHS